MKSAWITDKNRIELRSLDNPIPENDEVVVKIKACGICGTDLHYYNDYPTGKPLPLGHEVSGYVDKIGSGIIDLEKGDKVIVQNHIPCGRCTSCLNGNYAHCQNIITYMNTNSGMADFLKVKRAMVIPFHDLDFIEAALAEPITVALDITKKARIELFQNVCISGPGIIGLTCIKTAKLGGAKNVVVLGRRFKTKRGEKRREIAISMGACMVVDTDEPDWKEKIKKQFPGGFKRIIVTSPPLTISDTFSLASFGGIIAFNGISFRHENITFNANSFHFKKLKLVASHAIPNWGFPLAFEILTKKIIDYKSLVTHTFHFSDIEKAFEVANSKDESVIKVVVTF